MSASLEALWYVLAIASTLVFVYGVARPLAKYARGHRVSPMSRSELLGRVLKGTRTVWSQRTVGRRSSGVGLAHAGIFYGFLTLFLGTVILAINTDVTELIFGFTFLKGDFYLGYSVVLDVLGLALALGLLYMAVRRGFLRPARLDYRRPDRGGRETPERRAYRIDDWTFLGVLA